MVLIAINWLYITFLAFPIGFELRETIKRITGYSIKRYTAIIFAGLTFLTVYTQLLSLFIPIGIWANVILCIVSIALIIVRRKSLFEYFRFCFNNKLTKLALACFITLIWLYLSSRGWQHTDTASYHMQTIGWIQNYGIVKGLANLHYRLGYNSAIFSLFALVPMKEVFTETPVYSLNGYFALLLTLNSVSVFKSLKEKSIKLSDFIKAASIYYLALIVDEVFSPASDYSAIILVLYIFSVWIEELERKSDESGVHPFALLCVLAVFAASIKVTVGLVVLLTIKPAVLLIKQKQIKCILMYILAGATVILPWLLRNVIVSGYLIYPLYQLDLFNVDWKVHPQVVYQDALIIKEWGRGINYYGLEYMKGMRWYPIWFSESLSSLEKCFVITDYISIVAFFAINLKRARDKRFIWDYCLVETVVMLSFLYWQFSAPLPRYGYCHLILPSFLLFGELALLINKRWFKTVCVGGILLYRMAFFVLFLIHESGYLYPYYVVPKQLEDIDTIAYQVEDIIVSGNGGEYNPEIHQVLPQDGIACRGDDISDGFYNMNIEQWGN